ncbi:MAG TPA: heparinase II/III family protein [Candidatus Hungatella pullicola]|nr:heparinase II/III family protein [Candidatus Hungatella pullicola]
MTSKTKTLIKDFKDHLGFSHRERQAQVQACRQLWPEACDRSIRTADQLCEKTFLFQLPWDMEQTQEPVSFSDEIQWDFLFHGDQEFIFQMNRHRYWICLGQAYALTGDEKYAECFVTQLMDWISRVPYGDDKQKTTWRTLEAGLRGDYWIRAMAFFTDSSKVTENVWQTFFEALRVHGEYLYNNPKLGFSRKSNWGVMEYCGLYAIGKVLQNEEFSSRAAKRLCETAVIQVMEDGMQWEQSGMYHNEVLMSYLEVMCLADIYGETVFDHGYQQIVRKMALATMNSQNPAGKQPMMGDSDDTDVRDLVTWAAWSLRDETLKRGGFPVMDFEMIWLYGQEPFQAYKQMTEGEEPELLTVLADSGQIFYRSDWTDNGDWIHFVNGPVGGGHGHYDMLHVDLCLEGEEILTDSGRYTYMDVPLRYQLKAAQAHNVPVIGEKEYGDSVDSWTLSALPAPLGMKAVKRGEFAYFEGSHFGYYQEGKLLKRSILCIGHDVYAVMDEFQGAGNEICCQRWHFSETIAVDADKDQIVGKGEKAEFVMKCFANGENLAIDLSRTPISRHYNLLSERSCAGISARNGNSIITFIMKKKDGAEPSVVREPVYSAAYNKYLDKNQGEGFVIQIGDKKYGVVFLHNSPGNQEDFVGVGGCFGIGKVMAGQLKEGREQMTVLQW